MANVNYLARFKRAVAMMTVAGTLAACNRDKILTITDPDIIPPDAAASPEAAEALRLGAITRLSDVTGGLQGNGSLNEGIFHFSGVIADEWRSTDTFVQRDEADSRSITEANTAMTLEARGLNRTRVAAIQAIPVLQKWKPNNVSDVGQMYWIRGWAEMSIAENFCNGSPISSLDASNNIVFGDPETNVKIYGRAIATFDTAIQNAPAGDKRADTVKWLSGIEKAIVQLVFPTREANIAIASGTEARLIEAEVALRSGDVATFMAKLNFLRANFDIFKQPSDPCSATTQVNGCPPVAVGGALPPLVDPGTFDSEVDLLFRERAFWLWSTGHRLADLRRLVRPVADGGFGRAENAVFPNGPYAKGGSYGTDKFLVIPLAERNNPQFTGCLDRNP